MHKAEDFVSKHIKKTDIIRRGERVLLALSGGADSVGLLLILRNLGYDLVAAHCNFHLRGEESMRDERFVRELCERYGVRLVTTDFDTRAYAAERKLSIELAARDLRYDFFSRVMAEEGLDVLATGHHMDDNVETFLLNAARKSGGRGLCGMQGRSVNRQGCTVVRPLLCLRHAEIEDYLREMGQDWVLDSTNEEDDAARNKIRHQVVPTLELVNPAAVSNICHTMENLGEIMAIYEAEIARCKEACCRWTGNMLTIDRKRLGECVSPISVLHEVLSPLGFNSTQVRNLLTAKGYRCNRPKGATAMKVRGGTVEVAVTWKEISILTSLPR